MNLRVIIFILSIHYFFSCQITTERNSILTHEKQGLSEDDNSTRLERIHKILEDKNTKIFSGDSLNKSHTKKFYDVLKYANDIWEFHATDAHDSFNTSSKLWISKTWETKIMNFAFESYEKKILLRTENPYKKHIRLIPQDSTINSKKEFNFLQITQHEDYLYEDINGLALDIKSDNFHPNKISRIILLYTSCDVMIHIRKMPEFFAHNTFRVSRMFEYDNQIYIELFDFKNSLPIKFIYLKSLSSSKINSSELPAKDILNS